MRPWTKKIRKYEKPGNADTALLDFYSVQPANVQRKSNFNFGNLRKGYDGDYNIIGRVGDKQLILRPKGDRLSNHNPVLEIRTATDTAYDRIVYKIRHRNKK